MTRGKYASKAEATAVRVQALAEAQALRRDNARLIKENEALQGALNDTLSSANSEINRLRLLVASGTSEREQDLRQQVDDLSNHLADARREFGLEYVALNRKYFNQVPFAKNAEYVPDLLKLLGISAAELFVDSWKGSRAERRLRVGDLRSNREANVGWGTGRTKAVS